MNPADEMAPKTEPTERPSPGAAAGPDDRLDEQLRVSVEALLHPAPPRKPVEELDDLLLAISHHLDEESSERKAIYRRLKAIETGMEGPASRGFARYLVAICIGVAATLAWQSYGEVPKQMIAAKAPELGWSPEAKQMIASWMPHSDRTKQPASPESTAVQSSVQETQVATTTQTLPAKAPATPSIDPEQVHQIVVGLAALGRTVDQLAASQDQMVHQIDVLQTSNQEIRASNQEILAKIPVPPPLPTVAPTRKPTTRTPPSSRAPIARPYP